MSISLSMPIYRLNEELWFPPASEFEEDIVAVGGDISPQRVLLAIHSGIFPWYNTPNEPIWYSPQERCVFPLNSFRVAKSVLQFARKMNWKVTFDSAFEEVIQQCSSWKREGETWIFPEIKKAYTELHELGFAHSVEIWHEEDLVGGLYGVSLGGMFSGESMFSKESNASKFALACLVHHLKKNEFQLLDAQVENDHLNSLGAVLIDRNSYLKELKEALTLPTWRGKWKFQLNHLSELRSKD
jgi:leucyl/phenylalanyl-tRNA--protein transferase